MKIVRILIATTGGVVAIDRITAERAPQSMVCLKRTSQVLPISGAYDDFVRPGSGVIAREFGGQSYRLDLSDVVGSGESWQLAVFLAHAVSESNTHELAGPDVDAAHTYLVTGRVNYDLEVEPVEHIDEKIAAAAQIFASAGDGVSVIVPHGDNADRAISLLREGGTQVYPCARIADALAVIGLLAGTPPARVSQAMMPVVRGGYGRTPYGALLAGAAVIGIFWGALSWHQRDNDMAADAAVPEPSAVAKAAPPPPQSLGRVEVFGKYPPSGQRCASLLFSKMEPVMRPYDPAGERPCGFRLRITPETPARFAGVVVARKSGRLIEAASRVEGLSGDQPVRGALDLDLDVPLRQREAIDFSIYTIFGEQPVAAIVSQFRSSDAATINNRDESANIVETHITLATPQ